MSSPKPIAPAQLIDVLNQLKREIFTTINCVQIGAIEEFFPDTQTAKVQLVLKQVRSVAPDGTRTLQERPLLVSCPVFTLFGGDSFISMPIEKGDTCIVLFNDREIDEWFANGGMQTPQTIRAHDLSDGIVLVGIRSMQQPITDYMTGGVRVQFSPESKIDLTEAGISMLGALITMAGAVEVAGPLAAASLSAANGATGSFNAVNVINGIVVSGS